MERLKLKKCIIFLLVILNLFLVCLIVAERYQSRQYQSVGQESALAYLSKQGISLSEEMIPWESKLSPWTISRDRAQEKQAAQALIGTSQLQETSSVDRYQGDSGTVSFFRDGSFSVKLVNWAGGVGEDAALSVLESLGMTGEVIDTQDNGSRTTITVRQIWKEVPIFSCTAIVKLYNEIPDRVEGIRLADRVEANSAVTVRSPETLLIDFYRGLQSLGASCAEVRQLTEGYLQTNEDAILTLCPAWQLETDGGTFLLNNVTGELTIAG